MALILDIKDLDYLDNVATKPVNPGKTWKLTTQAKNKGLKFFFLNMKFFKNQ